MIFISDFIAGVGIYTLYRLGVALWRLGNLPGCKVRVDRHQYGVLSTGYVMFKCWSASAAVWLFYVISILAISEERSVTKVLTSPVVMCLEFSTLTFLVLSFILCQLPLHRCMMHSKQDEIIRIQKLLDQFIPDTAGSISEKFIRKTQFVEAQMNQARTLPEWPCTLSAILGTALAATLSAVPSALIMELFNYLMK